MPTQSSKYQRLMAMGAEPHEAAKLAKLSRLQKMVEDRGREERTPEDYIAGRATQRYMGSRDPADVGAMREVIGRGTLSAGDLLMTARSNSDEAIQEDMKKHRPFWKRAIVDPLQAGIQTLGVPQQAAYRMIVGDDWRKAIPDYLSPNSWENEGIAHEFMDIGDVVDHYADGGYEDLLGELNDAGGFKKWALGGGLKVLEFGGDVALDPMTYLAGAGLGTKLVKAFRRKLPTAVQAELTAKVARRFSSPTNIEEALGAGRKLVDEVAVKLKANPADDALKAQHASATASYHDILAQRNRLLSVKEGVDAVPHARPQDIPKQVKNPTPQQVGEHEARVKAAQNYDPMVMWQDMDDDMLYLRMGMGPDDAEFAGDVIRGLATGSDVDDHYLRRILSDAEPARTSGNSHMTGIGQKGQITDEMLRSDDLFQEIVAMRSTIRAQHEVWARATAAVKKNSAMSKLEKSVKIDNHKMMQSELQGKLDKLDGAIEYRGNFGTMPDDIGKHFDVKMPWGPRRDVLDSAEFMNGKYDGQLSKFWGNALYPQAHMPKARMLTASILFREPMRVLEERMPGAWDFLQGKMKTRELEVTGLSEKLRKIYTDNGLVEHAGAASLTKKVGVDLPTKWRVNKEADKKLWHLLDTEKGTSEWDTLLESYGMKADDKLIGAHDEIRAILNDYNIRNGIDPTMTIKGYITHRMPYEALEGGGMPFDFMGMRGGRALPFFKKERLGQMVDDVPGALEALDLYARVSAKHLYTDPMLNELERMVALHVKKTGEKEMTRFFGMLRDNVDGKPTHLGSLMHRLLGDNAADEVRKYAGAVGLATFTAAMTGNIRYPIMSMLQAFNTSSAKYGGLTTLRGMFRTLTPRGRVVARAAGIGQEYKAIFEDLAGVTSKFASETRVLGFLPSITDTEFAIRGMTFHASLSKQLSRLGYASLEDIGDKGLMREILAEAASNSENLNHVFGVLGKPVGFGRVSRTGSALATQFTSFPFKQTETLWAASKDNMGFAFDYLVQAGQLSSIAYRANLDIDEYVGLGYTEDLFSQGFEPSAASLPVDILAKGVMYATTNLDPTAAPDRALAAKQEFLSSIESIPAFVNYIRRIKERTGGVVRDGRGSLIREPNLSISTNDRFNLGNEFPSIALGLKSLQDTRVREAKDADKHRQSHLKAETMKFHSQISGYYSKGDLPPIELVSQYRQKMLDLGVIKWNTDLNKILQSEIARYNLTEQIRNADGGMYKALLIKSFEEKGR